MSLTNYCEFDEVRSALGVNDIELTDAVLSLPVYEMGLLRELNRLSTSLAAAFSSISDKFPEDRSEQEAAVYDSVRLFSVYAVAKQVGVSLANFAPKDVGDGKASISRHSGEPFEKVLAGIDKMYSALRAEAKDSYNAYAGASTTATSSLSAPVVFMASSRSFDPVTGS